ncbi:kelch-like protein 28 [Musca domestica]|uniref:Kelch-like protein diablo n=1 Tax=Musca domestica TaxID=7370 RepID=A0A1I8N1C2_MUSDO|nr:kelch-like protein 28 [Musca domestica]
MEKMDNSEALTKKTNNSVDLTKQESMKPRSFIRGTSGHLLQQLNEFRKREQFTDVVLLGCDGTRISAHRNILAAASPYFMAMFSGHFPESDQPEIYLPEIDTQCLQLVVEFIYTGLVDISDDYVQQLMQTASFLQLDHLSDMCGEHMGELLDPENCLGFKHFAEKQNNQILLEMAKDYIITHFQDVVQCEEFYEMSYEELVPILSNNELFMHSDDTILQGIVRWAEYMPEQRLSYLSQLLRFIHPMCVSAEVTRSLTTLQKQNDCSQWLSEVQHYEGSSEWRIFLVDKMGRNPETCRYDLKTGTMLTLKPPPRPAFAISLAAYKNILYIQGGSIGRSTNNCYYYNIYRDQWHDLAPLQVKRSHHRSLIVNDCLYAIGGNSSNGITNSVEYLNLATNKSDFCKPMLVHRSSMGAVVHGECMYVMGGEEEIRSYNCLERYDPRENSWQFLAPMNDVKGYCSSAVLGDNIYCCEGLGMCMERYDMRANRWEVIDFGEEREFYEIFTVDNQLYSTCGDFIAHYEMDANRWAVIHRFPYVRDWDYAVAMNMVNYGVEEE